MGFSTAAATLGQAREETPRVTVEFDDRGLVRRSAVWSAAEGEQPAAPDPQAGPGLATFGYDPVGRMISRTDAAAVSAFAWTARGELAATEQTLQQYRPADLDAAATPVEALTSTWTYDAASQPVAAELGGGATAGTSMRELGYEGHGWLTGDRLVGADGETAAETRYDYDADGNVVCQQVVLPTTRAETQAPDPGSRDCGADPQVDLDTGADVPPLTDAAAEAPATVNGGEGTHRYCYDGAGRLVRWDRPRAADAVIADDPDACGEPDTAGDAFDVVEYGWDDAGNRILAEDGVYRYDERNRLVGTPDGPISYAARGTRRSQPDGGEVAFDALGRQTRVAEIAFAYDGRDRIAVRSDTTADGAPTGRRFAYAATEWDPVADGDRTSQGGAVWAHGPDGNLLAAAIGPHLATAGEVETGGPLHVLRNRHGDLTATLRSDGRLVDSRTYDPFGESPADPGVSVPGMPAGLPGGQPVGYAAGTSGTLARGYQSDWTDPDTGQVWQGARWYAPSQAVFTARDTVHGELRTPISLNRYTYAWADPLTNTDPDGRNACEFNCGMGGTPETPGGTAAAAAAATPRGPGHRSPVRAAQRVNGERLVGEQVRRFEKQLPALLERASDAQASFALQTYVTLLRSVLRPEYQVRRGLLDAVAADRAQRSRERDVAATTAFLLLTAGSAARPEAGLYFDLVDAFGLSYEQVVAESTDRVYRVGGIDLPEPELVPFWINDQLNDVARGQLVDEQIGIALNGLGAFGIARQYARQQVASLEGAIAGSPYANIPGGGPRGLELERQLIPEQFRLPPNFKTFDAFDDALGLATSVKSFDLTGRTYADPRRLASTLRRQVRAARDFTSYELAGEPLRAVDISARQLAVVIRAGDASAAQFDALRDAVAYGASQGVQVRVVPVP